MANDDLNGVLVALGLLGLGAVGYIALSEHQKRQGFDAALRAALQESGIPLVSSQLGRAPGGAPVWYVTVNHPWLGVQTFSVVLDSKVDPYGPEAREELLSRLEAAVQGLG